MTKWARQAWLEAEPARAEAEKAAMTLIAPELEWVDDDPAGGWAGLVPKWPFARPAPSELDDFLDGRCLRVRVEYSQAYPMVEPKLWPCDPHPSPLVRSRHDWHVNGDGSICMLRSAAEWDGTEMAAELVVKAAGWFLEYLLMEDNRIQQMTPNGIVSDNVLDELFSPADPAAATN
jgi:hypothetical protein